MMTTPDPKTTHEMAAPDGGPQPALQEHGVGAHGGHRLMMIVCCIPMLVIAGLLVATGVAGVGLMAAAVLCTVMMAVMMFTMPGGHGRG